MNEEIRKAEELNENELENISGSGNKTEYVVRPIPCHRCGYLYNPLMPACPECGYSHTDG